MKENHHFHKIIIFIFENWKAATHGKCHWYHSVSHTKKFKLSTSICNSAFFLSLFCHHIECACCEKMAKRREREGRSKNKEIKLPNNNFTLRVNCSSAQRTAERMKTSFSTSCLNKWKRKNEKKKEKNLFCMTMRRKGGRVREVVGVNFHFLCLAYGRVEILRE